MIHPFENTAGKVFPGDRTGGHSWWGPQYSFIDVGSARIEARTHCANTWEIYRTYIRSHVAGGVPHGLIRCGRQTPLRVTGHAQDVEGPREHQQYGEGGEGDGHGILGRELWPKIGERKGKKYPVSIWCIT